MLPQRPQFRILLEGFLIVAHTEEEEPAEYIWNTINILKVSCIDHSNHALDDKVLVKKSVRRRIPNTLPLIYLKLGVIKRMNEHPSKKIMHKGLAKTPL